MRMLAVTGSKPAMHVHLFLLAFFALGRKSQRAQKGELCAAALAEVASLEVGRGSLFPPDFFFSMFFLRFIMLGGCWGQKHGFRPRCTGRAPEWSPKREMPVLASQALATDPFPRFFQARPARKLRLTDSKCSSAATQIFPTRLMKKPPKIAVFVAISPQRVFFANFSLSSCDHRPKASFAREYWLRNVAALACCFAPQGHFWGLETGTYGHANARAGALEAQIGAQNSQLVGSQAPRPF